MASFTPHPATASLYPDDLAPVPTVDELARQGLASKGSRQEFKITPAGQRLIRDALQANGQRLRAWDEERARRSEDMS